MATRTSAAVDLGAESGRVMVARYDGRRITLEEAHRFPNRPVRMRGHLFWNILGLWDEVLSGLGKARQQAGTLDSIGVDTWGVDYGLVDGRGMLLGQPFHYRDHRTDGIMERVSATLPRETIYQRTGIQFLPFNTLYQLVAHHDEQPDLFPLTQHLLMMPDFFHSLLCGEQVGEQTNATTTQCWGAQKGGWLTAFLDALGLPSAIMPPVVAPGTRLGSVLQEVRAIAGEAQVAVPATHDTGSAVAGIPATGGANWAYISSGTWSLVGLELAHPLINSAGLAANFTNEGGVFGMTRFLKNVMGLWLLQSCQRQWEAQSQPQPIDDLLAAAAQEPPFAALLDPDHSAFLAPDDMPTAINAWLIEHGQQPLQSPASFARSICESLVLRYCQVLQRAEVLAEQQIEVIHIVGGGSQNALMNQWLADAAGVPVIAGPTETTALGNALMQLVALGELHTLSEVRAVAVNSSVTTSFEPRPAERAKWDETAASLEQLTAVPIREN